MKRKRLLLAICCIMIFILLITYHTSPEEVTSPEEDPSPEGVPSVYSGYKDPPFIINEEHFCDGFPEPVLLVGVYSSPNQDLERDFIRTNWSLAARNNPKIRLLFFMGLPEKEEDMEIIRKESYKYHDIIVRDFVDSYRNLTLKSFAFFHWSQKNCNRAKYLLKIDCDMQINLLHLVSVLETDGIIDTFQCGKVLFDSFPYRDKNHKWYIPPSVYSKEFFPPYCYGPAYIVSRRIASKIAEFSSPSYAFPVDDVYMTGLLREKMREGLRQDFLFFHHHYEKTKTKLVRGKYTRYIMTVHVHYEIVP